MNQRIYCCVALLCLFMVGVYSNDSFVKVGAQGIQLIGENMAPVRLINENLYIELNKNNYSVKVDYTFLNEGAEIQAKLGFPIFIDVHVNELKQISDYITNFKTSVNGKNVDFVKEVKNYSSEFYMYADIEHIEYWFIKNVVFSSNKQTQITVEYTSRYNGKMGYNNAEYYYGSGNTWKNGIEIFQVEIKPNFQYIHEIEGPIFKDSLLTWKNSNMLTYRIDKVRPNIEDSINITTTDFGMLVIEGYFENSVDNDWLSLKYLTSKQLKLLRNGFYASKNFKFKSEGLIVFYKEHFKSYVPKSRFAGLFLGKHQKRAIKKIIDEEKKR